MKERRGNRVTNPSLAREQSDDTLVSGHVVHWVRETLCIHYIHPELRIGNCRFRSGKEAEPF